MDNTIYIEIFDEKSRELLAGIDLPAPLDTDCELRVTNGPTLRIVKASPVFADKRHGRVQTCYARQRR